MGQQPAPVQILVQPGKQPTHANVMLIYSILQENVMLVLLARMPLLDQLNVFASILYTSGNQPTPVSARPTHSALKIHVFRVLLALLLVLDQHHALVQMSIHYGIYHLIPANVKQIHSNYLVFALIVWRDQNQPLDQQHACAMIYMHLGNLIIHALVFQTISTMLEFVLPVF